MFAAIDLGSNSFHLLIARANVHGIEQFDRFSSKVQLAEGLVDSGRLTAAAMHRGYECLEELRDHLNWFDVRAVRAVGTHALRVASNAPQFVRAAEKILKVPIEVLSGELEAKLIYEGLHASQNLQSSVLVIDIGGGSTEFALGESDQLNLTFSEEMGCVTLRDQYFADGNINRENYNAAVIDVRQWVQLPASQLDGHDWSAVWGSSGTLKAVARMLNGLHGCGFVIQRHQLLALTKDMLRRRNVANLHYPYLNDDRKSVIIPGIIIINELMDELGIETILVSQASLREGLVWQMANPTF
ncbi:MAG: hypothetical protein AB8B86_02920 [Pseudomonadales bacterium]